MPDRTQVVVVSPPEGVNLFDETMDLDEISRKTLELQALIDKFPDGWLIKIHQAKGTSV